MPSVATLAVNKGTVKRLAHMRHAVVSLLTIHSMNMRFMIHRRRKTTPTTTLTNQPPEIMDAFSSFVEHASHQ